MKRLLPLLPAFVLLLAACQQSTDTTVVVPDTTAADPTIGNTATVRLTSTQSGDAMGYVNFIREGNGVRAGGTIENLPAGSTHGIHIHAGSSCDEAPPANNPSGPAEPAGAAGPHWDPMSTNHHAGPEVDASTRHGGDMGNITAEADGHATLFVMLSGISIDGPNGVVGRTVVLHANEDDLTSQPAGNSGARIACGVIELGNSGMMSDTTGAMPATTPGGVPGGAMDGPANPSAGTGQGL